MNQNNPFGDTTAELMKGMDVNGFHRDFQGLAKEINESNRLLKAIIDVNQKLVATSNSTTGDLTGNDSISLGTQVDESVQSTSIGDDAIAKKAKDALENRAVEFVDIMFSDSENKGKEVGNLIGSGIGDLLSTGLGVSYGPVGAAVGKGLGQMAGKILGDAFGGSKMKTFSQLMDDANKSILGFIESAEESRKTERQKIMESKGYLSEIDALQQNINDLSQQASEVSKDFRTEDEFSDSKTYQTIQNQIGALITEQALLQEKINANQEEILSWSFGLLDSIRATRKQRRGYVDEYFESKRGSSFFTSRLSTTQTKLIDLQEELKTKDAVKDYLDIALLREKINNLTSLEFETQKKLVSLRQAEIDKRKSLRDDYKSEVKKIQETLVERKRESWGLTNYQQLYRFQREQTKNAASPEKRLEWQRKQLETLKKIADLQKQQVEHLREAAKNTRKMVEDLRNSDLNPHQSFASTQAKYNQLKAKALTGDGEAINEYSSYSRTYLEEARKQMRSSKQYEALFHTVTRQMELVATKAENRADRIEAGGGSNLNIDIEYKKIQERLTDGVVGLNGSIDQMNRTLNQFILGMKQVGIIQDTTGFAEGGIATGPSSGHLELLHGTEAVIPLGRGAVPLVITGGPSSSTSTSGVESKLDRQNDLLGELIDVARAQGKSGSNVVVIDTKGIEQNIQKTMTEGSRRGVQDLGIRPA